MKSEIIFENKNVLLEGIYRCSKWWFAARSRITPASTGLNSGFEIIVANAVVVGIRNGSRKH
jgi:hypothetical protein